MEIRESSSGDVTVLHLAGDIYGRKDEPDQFQSTIDQLIAGSKLRIVLELSDVRMISSVGLGMLVDSYKKLTQNNGAMVIAHPSPSIKPIFDVLESPLKCFDSEDQAVASLQG